MNRYGITFTGKWNLQKIDYLDLEIIKPGDSLSTRTFFKSPDRNGYIPISSWHHPKWKSNIPKGQLLRLRQNCNKLEDFEAQADFLIQRFQEKGYIQDNLVKLKLEIMNMDRNTLLNNKKTRTKKMNKWKQMEIASITGFNNQYKDVERIIKKYWPILKPCSIQNSPCKTEIGILESTYPSQPPCT